MFTKMIEISQTNMTIEELLAQLSSDAEIVLTRNHIPIARLAAEPPSEALPARILGLHAGQGWMSDDFNDALPDSFWLGGR